RCDVRAILVFAALVLAVLGAGPAGARSLRDTIPDVTRQMGIEGGTAFDALSDAFADTAARNIPTIAASAGYTYRYNAQLEVFERTSETLGPIYLDRPNTLGRGKLNINVSYQYVRLDEYDGDDTSNLHSSNPVITRVSDVSGLVGFSAQDLRYSMKLMSHIVGISVTYGILDDLDVNMLLPLINTNMDVRGRAQQVATAGTDGVFSPQP